jgi:hypothetical protein
MTPEEKDKRIDEILDSFRELLLDIVSDKNSSGAEILSDLLRIKSLTVDMGK